MATIKDTVHLLLARDPDGMYRETNKLVDWLLEQPELEGRARSSMRRIIGELKREGVVAGGERYRRQLQRERGKRLEDSALMREVLRAVQRLPPIEVTDVVVTPPSRCDALVVFLSDWHIGQCFDFPLGRYNKDIANERVGTLTRRVCNHIRRVAPREVAIAVGGDMLDGVLPMRDQHALEQDLHEGEQIAMASALLSRACHAIATDASRLTGVEPKVYSVGGNHDRAGGARDRDTNRTFAQVLARMLEAQTGLRVEHADRLPVKSFTIADTLFLVTHGDRKPAAIEKLVAPWTRVWSGPVVVLNGHFHHFRAQEMGRIMLVQGGSLPGIETFASLQLGLHSCPSQALVEIRNGVAIPIFLPL